MSTAPLNQCNGLCVTAAEVGVIADGVAYAHPECPEHGAWYSGHDPRDIDCEFDTWDEVGLVDGARCPICSTPEVDQ